LGLKKIANENGKDIPALFMDEGYAQSCNFRLSTSQVPSLFEAFMCYGPVVPDGYGCCYNPTQNSIVFGVSAFNSSPETSATRFKLALQETLLEMQKVGVMSDLKPKL
jgi:carnitine O-acetyltransferase